MRRSPSALGRRRALQRSRRSFHVPSQQPSAAPAAPGPAATVKAKAFDRVDTNDDRKIDQAELQATFDAVAAKTGKPARDAAAVIAKIDTDGDGALTRREIRAEVRELRASPASTLELARRDVGRRRPRRPGRARPASSSEGRRVRPRPVNSAPAHRHWSR